MRLILRPEERRPAPEPLATDDRRVAAVGLIVWTVALILALVRREDLMAEGNGWYLGTCVAGIALGLAGLAYLHRRRSRSLTDTADG